MKSIITLLTAAAITFLGSTTQADARHQKKNVHISSYQSCGTPIYTERYLIGYDECGDPVFGYRTVRSSYRPVVRQYYAPRQQPRYQRGYNHGGGYSNGRVTIQGSFCR
jgi:hypothetical protein